MNLDLIKEKLKEVLTSPPDSDLAIVSQGQDGPPVEKGNKIKDIQYSLDFSKIGLNEDLAELLSLLEEVNPCDQTYYYGSQSLVISYKIKLNLLNFKNSIKVFKNVRVVGLPISIGIKGYYGDLGQVKEIIGKMKGFTIVLNGDKDLGVMTRTLSTLVFDNKYKDLDHYLESLRSPYRRRLKNALNLRESILISKLHKNDFTKDHYDLYINVVQRSKDPLEVLTIDFFRSYDGDLFEFIDRKTNKLLAFIQVKLLDDTLYFLFCGFYKEDNKNNDLYYNILLSVLEIGFERKVKTIDFGQTSEESKLKLGCREVVKYLYIHHSSPPINCILKKLSPFFTYKPYGIRHRVFKEGKRLL